MKNTFIKKISSKKEVEAEVHGVTLLSKYVNTPRLLDFDDSSITYEMIDVGAGDTALAVNDLVSLHQISCENFGLERNNFIGKGVQINTQTKSCGEFYLKYRIGYQVSLLREENLKNSFMDLIKVLETNWTPKCQSPSLCHGDLWNGNLIFNKLGTPYFIDPAVYFGDPLSDLAMAKLFGGFSDKFFHDYYKLADLDYVELDFKIYQLYHALNHLNIFGSSYKKMCLDLSYEISSIADNI